MSPSRWLMKAEPDSRVVKGKDVKFSVDDFESLGKTAWEGVRNHEAKNLMKSMKIGDQVLFYHSNCKKPGVAGFAEVCKEAYPDHTAWDPEHPYYDAKTDQSNPRWYMVDLQFTSRAKHHVSLALIKHIASGPETPFEGVEYIGEEGVRAITAMPLVNRGRLSVQRVDEDAWHAISALAERGGWDEDGGANTKAKRARKGKKGKAKAKTAGGENEGAEDSDEEGEGQADENERAQTNTPAKRSRDNSPNAKENGTNKKRKVGGSSSNRKKLNVDAISKKKTRASGEGDGDGVDGDGGGGGPGEGADGRDEDGNAALESDLTDLSDAAEEEEKKTKKPRTKAKPKVNPNPTSTKKTSRKGQSAISDEANGTRPGAQRKSARRNV